MHACTGREGRAQLRVFGVDGPGACGGSPVRASFRQLVTERDGDTKENSPSQSRKLKRREAAT